MRAPLSLILNAAAVKLASLPNLTFRQFPKLEVLCRFLYWRLPLTHLFLSFLKPNQWKTKKIISSADMPDGQLEDLGDLDNILEHLASHGLRRGDILILHSSFREIRKFEHEPATVIKGLLDFLGPEGTLAIPAFPIYPDAPKGRARITRDMSNDVFTFDVAQTPPWTGVLALSLMNYPGAIRSSFPLNSLVAVGADAEAMFEYELTTALETPNGPNSAWAYCAKKNAFIAAFGVGLVHSLTMIHNAEDCHEDKWPISNWYRNRKFRVVNGNEVRKVEVRERHPRWAINYAEHKFSDDLQTQGLCKITNLNGVQTSSIRSQPLLRFLESRRKSSYPYHFFGRHF